MSNHIQRVTLKAPIRVGQGTLLSKGESDSHRLQAASETTIACLKLGIEVDRCAPDGTAIAMDGRRFFLSDGELCEEAIDSNI